MAVIKFKIVTPEKVVYEDEISQLTLPTEAGEITVLPNHLPMVSVLRPGEMIIKKDGQEVPLAVSGGFIQIKKNEIVILADTAERAEEIDEARAEEARLRAQKGLEDIRDREAVDYTAMAARLEKELARLRVARKRKHRSLPNN